MTRPSPLTDADSDLTMFRDMPLEVQRFAQSDLVAFSSADAVLAALMLWGASWHSRPAGSLTNDERALMRAAGFGRGAEGAWHAVRDEALRGWIECSDGRLYHPVVAEKVREAWASRLKHKHRTYLAAIRVHNSRNPNDQRDGMTFDDWLEHGRPEGAKRAQARPQQEMLDLPENEARRVTSDDVARNIPDGNAEHDPMFALKSVEGKGSDRKGSDNYNNNNPESAKPRDDVAEEVMDAVGWANRLTRLAGVPHMQPSRIAQNVATVAAWLKDGIDLDAVVVPIIETFRLDKPEERLSTLGFFDQSVRAKVASAELRRRKPRAGQGSFVSTIAAPPVEALRSGDADDDRVRAIRSRLNGDTSVSPERIALAIRDDGEATLLVTARSAFAKAQLDLAKLKDATHDVLGTFAVEITIQ